MHKVRFSNIYINININCENVAEKSRSYRRIPMKKILWGVGSLTSNKPFDLGADPDQCRDSGIFNGILSLRDKAVVRILRD